MPTNRPDTPLAKSPDAITTITNIKTALADIEKRAQERMKAKEEANKKPTDRIDAISKARKKTVEGRLYGLASFSSTTGK